MPKTQSADLARICREQAQLANTREVRKVLTELAEHYEGEGRLLPASPAHLEEGQGKRIE